MNYQTTLEQLAAKGGLTLTPLRELSRIASPRKICCCGGWVLYTYAESAVDSSVVLRDSSGSTVCAFHHDILSLYPDVLTTHSLVLLQDVSFIPSINRKSPSFIVAGLPHLVALMLPEEEDDSFVSPPTIRSAAITESGQEQYDAQFLEIDTINLDAHNFTPACSHDSIHQRHSPELKDTWSHRDPSDAEREVSLSDDKSDHRREHEHSPVDQESQSQRRAKKEKYDLSLEVGQRSFSRVSPDSTHSSSLKEVTYPHFSSCVTSYLSPKDSVLSSFMHPTESVSMGTTMRTSSFSTSLPRGLSCENQPVQQTQTSQPSKKSLLVECQKVSRESDVMNKNDPNEEEEEEGDESDLEEEEDAMDCLEFAD